MNVVLVTFKPDGSRVKVPLTSPTVTLGRGDECAVRIPTAKVSRKHCELALADDGLRVRDLGSSNGTFVNGDRVTEVSLSAGDVLRVGRVCFTIQIDGQPAEFNANQSIASEDSAAVVSAPAPVSEPADADDALAAIALSGDGDPDKDGSFVGSELSEPAKDDDSMFLDSFESADDGDDEEDPLAALELLADEKPEEDEPL
jgi:predicted component of type VI protein secretion system